MADPAVAGRQRDGRGSIRARAAARSPSIGPPPSKMIERLRPAGTPRPLVEVLEARVGLVKQKPQARKEIYVFTDLAQAAWKTPAAADLTKLLADNAERAAVCDRRRRRAAAELCPGRADAVQRRAAGGRGADDRDARSRPAASAASGRSSCSSKSPIRRCRSFATASRCCPSRSAAAARR